MTVRRVKITNPGGAGWQTKIIDTETEKEILNVSHIDISIDARGMPMAAVYTFVAPAVDLTVNANMQNVCPCCRQVLTIGDGNGASQTEEPT